jgi:hypothetical protein
MTRSLPPARTLTTTDQLQATEPLRRALQGVFDTSLDVFIDRPAFVASDDPVNPLSGAVRAVTRLNCRLWAAKDKRNYSARVNVGNSRICGPYLESIGENPSGAQVGPEFDGGQCGTIQYRVDFTRRFGGTTTSSFINVTGPVLGSAVGSGPPIAVGSWQGIRLQGNRSGPSLVQAGDGTTVRTLATSSDPNVDPNSVTITGVTPTVSQPDPCGDPAPIIRPPDRPISAPVFSPSFEFDFPGLGPVNINVDLDEDGNPVVCIPELDTCFTIDDDDGGGGGGGGGDAPPPGDIGEPGDASSTGDGGDAEGEAPDGSVLVGLKVEVLSTPPNPREYRTGVLRGAAYIYMGVPGNLDQDFGGSMLRDGQFFFAEKDNLTAWAVSANVGYNLRVTPYYREVEES